MTVILHPPERFDMNEWYTLISAVLVLTIAILLPRRFSSVHITVIVVFTVFLSQTVDSLIAVQPYDLYDVSDSSKYEIIDVVIYYICYPPYAYIFVYFYDKWKLKGILRILYIIGFTLLSTALEWVSVIFHVFTYKGWHIWYSPFVYLGVYTSYILMHHVTEAWLGKKIKEDCVPVKSSV
jgi:hypothetical protein